MTDREQRMSKRLLFRAKTLYLLADPDEIAQQATDPAAWRRSVEDSLVALSEQDLEQYEQDPTADAWQNRLADMYQKGGSG